MDARTDRFVCQSTMGPDRLNEDQDRLGLPSDAVETLRSLAQRHHGWRAYVHSE